MDTTWRRIFGIAIVIIAAASLLFSVFAVVQLWRLREPAQASITRSLDLISATLETTSDVLYVTELSLDAAVSSIGALEGTVDTLGSTIEGISPLVDSLATLSSDSLPGTVRAVQNSLESAQASARVIDSVLQALTIFNRNLYNPDTPLHETLGNVSDGLDSLYTSFSSIEESLTATSDNLQNFKDKIDTISENISTINQNLVEAKNLMSQYRLVMENTQSNIARIKENLPLALNLFALFLSFIILWIGVVQGWLLYQGWNMIAVRSLLAGSGGELPPESGTDAV